MTEFHWVMTGIAAFFALLVAYYHKYYYRPSEELDDFSTLPSVAVDHTEDTYETKPDVGYDEPTAFSSPALPPIQPVKPVTPPAQPLPPKPPKMTPVQRLYQVAKNNLGKHLAAAPNVPEEVGCVTAVVFNMRQAEINIPASIVSVNALTDWCLAHGFTETFDMVPGAIITSHRKKRGDPDYAHAGIIGKTWIMSNTSVDGPNGLRVGLFQANFKNDVWRPYWSSHGSITRIFVPV